MLIILPSFFQYIGSKKPDRQSAEPINGQSSKEPRRENKTIKEKPRNCLYVFFTERNGEVYKPESYFMETSLEFLSQTVKTKKKIMKLINQTEPSFLCLLRCSKGTVVDDLLKIALKPEGWKKADVDPVLFEKGYRPIKPMSVRLK